MHRSVMLFNDEVFAGRIITEAVVLLCYKKAALQGGFLFHGSE